MNTELSPLLINTVELEPIQCTNTELSPNP